MIPTVAIIIESKTVDYIRGFNDLGDTDEFKTQTLEWRLAEFVIFSIYYVLALLSLFIH